MHHAVARRAAIGVVAGLVSGSVLALIIGAAGWLIVGALTGVGFAVAFSTASYLERSITLAALGVPAWCVANVVAMPLLTGQQPQWTADGMRSQLPGLIAWVLFGATFGLLSRAFADLADWQFGPALTPDPPVPAIKTRIVVLGGGFGGVTTAEHLEHAFGADRSVSVSLVSDTNALLFTPMLAEVAGSSLEPTHISSPLRSSLRRTRIIRGRVTDVDFNRRRVILAPESTPHQRLRVSLSPLRGEAASAASGEGWLSGSATGSTRAPEVSFDHLVLAVGSKSHYLGLDNVRKEALDFKSLADAIRIRNHVIDVFERADRTSDATERRALLTIVVAGGGFAGTELAGALNDFTRGMLVNYPNIPPEELRIILVHSRDRILPELSSSLAEYALARMAARGVTFKLGTRVADARHGLVVLNPREEIQCHTLVWTAGVTPNPLLAQLDVERDPRGAVIVDETLRVRGQTGVWALGDCAAVVDARTGRPSPPTAQFALREAATVAYNIRASVTGRKMRQFHFDAFGTLCVVGHHTACAEIKGVRFSGFFAWVLWRAIYLSKLPGLERKVRVVADWLIELFFPRDIVQTLELERSAEA